MTPRRCPFCGSCDGPRLANLAQAYAVECRNCGACGAPDDTESGAISKWNIRRNHRVEKAQRIIRDFILENRQ